MTTYEMIIGGVATSVSGAVVYIVNNWVVPIYKGFNIQLEALREEIKQLTIELTDTKSELSYLRGKYAEKTVLKSGKLKAKK